MKAKVLLTPQEYETLMRTGFVKISDPQRGEIEMRMFFGEDTLGPEGKHGQINVIRAGTSAKVGRPNR